MKLIEQTLLLFVLLAFVACKPDVDEPEDECKYMEQITNILEIMNMPRPADSYNYPVYRGMPEWADMTREERIEKMQVPVERLKKMSTQAVIQAIYEHPSFDSFLSYSSFRWYQIEFESCFNENNAYLELIQRTDAGT